MNHKLRDSLKSQTGQRLMEMYNRLYERYGPQNWWPAKSPFEVIVGAVLTQNTNWKNVEKAIKNLEENHLLSLDALYDLPAGRLSQLIRPAGYFNIKALRLKNLIEFIVSNYGLELDEFLSEDTGKLREKLLSVKGIGPETADSILLYACSRPIFVVDAYTFRILKRHNMTDDQESYAGLQSIFMDHLPEDVNLYNEFHALIVRVAKEHCKKSPLCQTCPLDGW